MSQLLEDFLVTKYLDNDPMYKNVRIANLRELKGLSYRMFVIIDNEVATVTKSITVGTIITVSLSINGKVSLSHYKTNEEVPDMMVMYLPEIGAVFSTVRDELKEYIRNHHVSTS